MPHNGSKAERNTGLIRCLMRRSKAVVDLRRLALAVPRLLNFVSDWKRYSRLAGEQRPRLRDAYPCLWDRTPNHPWDAHYQFQSVWAFRRVLASGVVHHVDVGSPIDYVTLLTAVVNVTFMDVRPLSIELESFAMRPGNILDLPFEDCSVRSLSCLHVVEHVGLGRYGDALDPGGTRKALRELARVLSPGGNLYLSVPVGRSRVCFNAHRILSAREVLRHVERLELVEFSGVDDSGVFREHRPLDSLDDSEYGCGFFWLRRA